MAALCRRVSTDPSAHRADVVPPEARLDSLEVRQGSSCAMENDQFARADLAIDNRIGRLGGDFSDLE